MKILVINAGSSSLKYQLFDMENLTVIAKGQCERIGIDGKFKQKINPNSDSAKEFAADIHMVNHSDAIKNVLDALLSKEHGVINDLSEITAVGHRIVHGGERFTSSTLVDDDTVAEIEKLSELAPLHNPPSLMGIRACLEVMHGVPQVAVFDTSFHSTIPSKSYLYPIPYWCYKKYGIRRYGFHGTSHKYVANKAAEYLEQPIDKLRIITCHLGNGSSVTAVKYGKSIDTSMGFTPLEGLVMGTRSGTIDPSIISFLMEKESLTPHEVNELLNKQSGLLGITGSFSDIREILEAVQHGDERAKSAVEILCYQIKKYIGAYAAVMHGVNAVVFTAGIGENNPIIRELAVSNLEFMGIKIDKELNNSLKPGALEKTEDISTEDSKVKVLVIPTNEELMIALDTENILKQ